MFSLFDSLKKQETENISVYHIEIIHKTAYTLCDRKEIIFYLFVT